MIELNITLAGANFRPAGAKEFIKAELNRNTPVFLEREPGNRYDSNAIKIICKDHMEEEIFIGYVPKTDNAVLAQHLDAMGSYTLVLTGFAGTIQPTFRITFEPPSIEERNAAVDAQKHADEQDELARAEARKNSLDDEIPF